MGRHHNIDHDDDDSDAESCEASMQVTVRRRGKHKSGFAVEQGADGFFYICKVPKGYKKLSVGDRVLNINGVSHEKFKNKSHANDLLECFQLEL
jgi:hypothetical protein